MSDTPSQQQGQPLKYTITHHRNKKHTHEEFMKWFVKEHIRLAMPVFKRHGVITYSLFDTPASLNDVVKAEVGKIRPGWEFADYDCVIEYTLPSMQAIQNVISDPEWANAVKDQDEWVEGSKALVSLGHWTPYLLETGEVVNVPK
ncbi:hypothetical protein F4780DRAFT_53438 [Xylariomycetidae sp. FL0641]|nr:hypothetical protein F4780DRAFT_53438 [Xylariomycetidae sp. FL0641]